MAKTVSQRDLEEWQKYRQRPEALQNQIRRKCRQANLELEERQNGSSHWVAVVKENGQTKGNVIVPVHGEIKKGTFGSILATLAAIGILIIILGCGAWYWVQIHGLVAVATGGN